MNAPEQQGESDDLDLGKDRSYAQEAVKGSAWVFLQTAIRKSLTIVVQLILARLLFPSDFGLVGIAVAATSIISIINPAPILDLLLQRGRKLPNALRNAWRLAFLSAFLIGAVIVVSAFFVYDRPGHAIRTNANVALTAESPLSDISADPPLPELLRNLQGTLELNINGAWVETELPPPADDQTSIGQYAKLMQSAFDERIGSDVIRVTFESDQDRIRLTTKDGAEVPIRSSSSQEGAILDTLGISYFSTPLFWLLILLSFRPLLWALYLPFTAVLRLQLRFDILAKTNVVSNSCGQFSAVFLAFFGAGSIALLMPHLVQPALQTLFLFFIVRPLPRPRNDEHEKMLPIVRDSSSLWIAQWIHTATIQGPNLILAYFVSSRDVGFFYFAFTLSVQIIAILSHNISHALMPIFSNLQGQTERLTSGFLRSAGAITGVSMPLFLGAASTAPVVLPMIFGERWIPAVPLLMILLLAQAFASTNAPTGSLLKSAGRYRTWLVFQAVLGVLFMSAVVLASWAGGALGVALAILGQQVIFAPIGLYICVRGMARKRDVARIHLVPLIAGLPMFPAAFLLYLVGPSLFALFVWCPISLLITGALYIVIMRILDRPRYDEILSIGISVRNKAFRTLGVGSKNN